MLKYIVGMEDDGYTPPPENSLPFDFEGYRRAIDYSRETAGSFFPGAFGAALRQIRRHLIDGDSGNRYTFCFRCQMHEDEFGEQSWTFIEWLAPHTETGGLGYFYGMYTGVPTLIRFRDGEAEFYDIELKHVGTLGSSEDQRDCRVEGEPAH
ncbi:MAG: hypothetical protein U9R15_13935 [Chloroflexota bacterium]|nr:hypothetical protein [Chloroflexota bacterium]